MVACGDSSSTCIQESSKSLEMAIVSRLIAVELGMITVRRLIAADLLMNPGLFGTTYFYTNTHTCTHIQTHMHMHTHTHKHKYTHVSLSLVVCVCVCVCGYWLPLLRCFGAWHDILHHFSDNGLTCMIYNFRNCVAGNPEVAQ